MVVTPVRYQFAIFVAIGALAAALTLIARVLLSLAMSFELAVILAAPVGITVAFLLNRRYVFHATGGNGGTQYVRFFLVNLIAAAQVWAVSVGLVLWAFPAVGFTWHADLVAHTIGLASPMFTSFLLHKHFSFRGAK